MVEYFNPSMEWQAKKYVFKYQEAARKGIFDVSLV